jgi:hypothetical protein
MATRRGRSRPPKNLDVLRETIEGRDGRQSAGDLQLL